MASVINRGTKAKPALYASYKDADGVWQQKKIPAEHCYSKKDADRYTQKLQEDIDAGKPDPRKAKTFSDLAGDWRKTLKNRDTINDDCRLGLHLLPYFGAMLVTKIDQSAILDFIDKQRQTPKRRGKGMLSESTIRHNVNLLSRFFGWCVPRHLPSNPIAGIAQGKRPQPADRLRGELPWIDDDKTVRDLFHALPAPHGLIFYIGNRTGARLGEVCGLRLSSFANVDRGFVTLRWTYDDGCLKEDKKCAGKSKNAPVPPDLAELVKAQLERRRAEGATSESLMFPSPHDDKAYGPLAIERAWIAACASVGFTKPHPDDADRQIPRCTFYEGTRHSFISRNLRDTRGRALYEIARAVGHADTSMIAKHYARWVIEEFSDDLRGGLGLRSDQAGGVIQLRRTA